MIFAQSITIFVVPFIGIALYFIANDAAIMGALKNTVYTKVFAGLGLVVLIGLAIKNIQSLFF